MQANLERPIAEALTSPFLHKDELCFLHALHLRFLAEGATAEVSPEEVTRVAEILDELARERT